MKLEPTAPEDAAPADPLPAVTMPDLVRPMFTMARSTQAALADAALAGLEGALSNAQKVVETTRNAARERATREWRGGDAVPTATPSGLEAVSQAVTVQSREALGAMTELAQRRADALLSFSTALAACKTPQEVLGLQLRFWQGAAADCVEGSRRVLEAINPALRRDAPGQIVPTVKDVVGPPAARPSKSERERAAAARLAERVTFRDPSDPPAVSIDPPTPGSGGPRRVA
jgi:hypothetical protein